MSENLEKLALELQKIEAFMLKAEKAFGYLLEKVHPSHHKNAINLLHYLALRSLDIRELQDALHAEGLSSMASSESHVMGQLIAIQQHVGISKPETEEEVMSYAASKQSLHNKSVALFGKKEMEAVPYIMITFDTSLASDYDKVKSLLQSGMNIARINCAHDEESTWFMMIQQIKRASKVTGLSCRIYMDLAGPKIRTVIHKNGKLKVEEGHSIYLTDESQLNGAKNTIGCTIPAISSQLKSGETVLFDDGLIETRVEKIEEGRAKLRILRVSSKKPFIKNEKGINFPDSTLLTPALTDYDLQCLQFIRKHADIVGYSFVRNTKDIIQLQEALGNNKKPALVIKIETPEAVKNLPDLLFCAMREENTGVMIARGDLAVEIGFERMSEIQEEILWICEAAHLPVIWATQVLENLNKSGLATRSEVTDAAHAALAECVMINKGVHIIHTIEALRDILARSGGHHVKKRFTFRPLAIASRFMAT
jgi:pyruvate kinase